MQIIEPKFRMALKQKGKEIQTTKNSRASGKAGPSSSIMSLGLSLHSGFQHFHTYLFSMEFGKKKKKTKCFFYISPIGPVKVLELILIGSGLALHPSLNQSLLPGRHYSYWPAWVMWSPWRLALLPHSPHTHNYLTLNMIQIQ